jgi:filamentous hemagglutinin family protein
VNFRQPNRSAIAVNRIADTNGSRIMGHLNANGQVWLINPNGILFGATAQVNVGGLVASTLDTTDGSTFSGNGTGSVVNAGRINASQYVALLGHAVTNRGLITAQMGTVALGAGDQVSLSFSGNRLVKLQVNRSVLDALVANHGLIQADGGMVIMNAGARDTLLASVVNNDGIVEARTVADHKGSITLLGGMAAGTVKVGGTLDASAPDGGDGGHIETSAAHVTVADGTTVTTHAAHGLDGDWLIDPVDFIIAPATLFANRGHVVIHTRGGGQGRGNPAPHLDDDTPSTTTTATASPTITTATPTATTTTVVIATDTVDITDMAATTDMTVPLADAENAIAGFESLFAQPMFSFVDAHANGDLSPNAGMPLNGEAHPGGEAQKGTGKHHQKRRSRRDAIVSERLVGSGMLRIDGGGMRLPSGTI